MTGAETGPQLTPLDQTNYGLRGALIPILGVWRGEHQLWGSKLLKGTT